MSLFFFVVVFFFCFFVVVFCLFFVCLFFVVVFFSVCCLLLSFNEIWLLLYDISDGFSTKKYWLQYKSFWCSYAVKSNEHQYTSYFDKYTL